METLSLNQIDEINDLLVDQGVNYGTLRDELLDHICCAIEEKMDRGLAYAEARSQSIHDFGPQGLVRTQEATIYLLTLKLRKMKRLAAVLGLIGGMLTVFGTAFKILRYPYAGELLIVGITTIVALFLPIILLVQFKNSDGSWDRASMFAGMTSAIVLGAGTLFKIMMWPGASALLLSGAMLLGVVFMPLYFVRSYRLADNKLFRSSIVVVIFAGLFLFFGLTRVTQDPRLTDGTMKVLQQNYLMQEEITQHNAGYAEHLLVSQPNDSDPVSSLKNEADALYDYIEEMQFRAMASSNGISVEQARQAKVEHINWMAGPEEIQQLLLSSEGEYTVIQLRKRMEAFRQYALAQYNLNDRKVVGDHLVFSTLEGWEKRPKHQPWSQANFQDRPLFYVVSYLDILKTETRNMESQVLNYLLGQRTVANTTGETDANSAG